MAGWRQGNNDGNRATPLRSARQVRLFLGVILSGAFAAVANAEPKDRYHRNIPADSGMRAVTGNHRE